MRFTDYWRDLSDKLKAEGKCGRPKHRRSDGAVVMCENSLMWGAHCAEESLHTCPCLYYREV